MKRFTALAFTTLLGLAWSQPAPTLELHRNDALKLVVRATQPFTVDQEPPVKGMTVSFQGLTLNAPDWRVFPAYVNSHQADLNNDGKLEAIIRLAQGSALGRYDERLHILTVVNGKIREVPFPAFPQAFGKTVQVSAGKLVLNGKAVLPFQLHPGMKFIQTDPKFNRLVPQVGEQLTFILPDEDNGLARDELIVRVSVSIGGYSVGQLVTTLKLKGTLAKGAFEVKSVTFEAEGPQAG